MQAKELTCTIVMLLVYPATWRAAEGPNRAIASPPSALAKALLEEDLATIRAAVAVGREALGPKAGEPEVADEYRPVPSGATRLTPEEAKRGFTPYFALLEKGRWWRVGIDPSTLGAPLRVPASVIGGSVAAVRAKLDGVERSLDLAKDAADFLVWAQQQAGPGLYPFPAARGTSNARAMEVATRFLAKAEKAGQLDRVVRNGWVIEDLGDGGLQFDNGECGVAMFDLYEVTKDPRHLASARRAADWAASRPLCPNWNYNSFSVRLLAKACAVTSNPHYLDTAIRKARLGVIPGQLQDGPYAGRWMDPHNARPAYHYLMLSALAELAAVMPRDHADRAEVMRTLTLGLKTRNAEIVSRGIMNKDKAVEALLLANDLFRHDTHFLRDTQSHEALRAMILLLSAEARRGNAPLSPNEWGHLLEYIVQSNSPR